MNKALKACADYARLSGEIRRLSVQIGEHIGKCPGVNGDLQPAPDDGWYMRYQKDRMHLKEAYTPDPQGFPPENVYMEPGDIEEYLAVCPHCLAAHEAIQARKAARKQFGIVKRAISAMGRAENARNAK
jgi:hypothetical protein